MDGVNIYVTEFVCTAMMLAFGTSANATVMLKETMGGELKTSWLSLLFGWGFGITFAVFTALYFKGVAHLNPVVTLSFALGGRFPWDLVPGTIIAQMLGGFVGAVITMIFYYPHFKITKPEEGNSVNIFGTHPMIKGNKLYNCLQEGMVTFFLILGILTLGVQAGGLMPISIGFLIVSLGLSFGSATGYAMNPARDFGPRLAYAILPVPNKGDANWGYFWVPIVGPIIGGAAAMGFFKLLVAVCGIHIQL